MTNTWCPTCSKSVPDPVYCNYGVEDACGPCMARMLAAERSIATGLKTANAEMGSILDWVADALISRATSDFAESFPIVRRAVDLRTERDMLARQLDDEREATLVLKRRIEALETIAAGDCDA